MEESKAPMFHSEQINDPRLDIEIIVKYKDEVIISSKDGNNFDIPASNYKIFEFAVHKLGMANSILKDLIVREALLYSLPE